MSESKVPVTVLTGFLGAGKTTLLNHLLTENHGKKFAILINEFGELSVDSALVIDADEEVFETNNGCVCCTVRGDLIRILGSLLRRRQKFDGIIVETTGLADPAPVAQTFFLDENLREKARLDAVVTVVDAINASTTLEESHEAQRQIAFADVILLNKTDLVDEAQCEAVIARLRAINAHVEIHKTQHGAVAPHLVLDRGGFDLERALETMPAFLTDTSHTHEEGITSLSFLINDPLDEQKFNAWIGPILQTQGADILRAKGILYFKDAPERFAFQAVHMLADGNFIGTIKDDEPRESRIVFIGRNLNRPQLRRGFEACKA